MTSSSCTAASRSVADATARAAGDTGVWRVVGVTSAVVIHRRWPPRAGAGAISVTTVSTLAAGNRCAAARGELAPQGLGLLRNLLDPSHVQRGPRFERALVELLQRSDLVFGARCSGGSRDERSQRDSEQPTSERRAYGSSVACLHGVLHGSGLPACVAAQAGSSPDGPMSNGLSCAECAQSRSASESAPLPLASSGKRRLPVRRRIPACQTFS